MQNSKANQIYKSGDLSIQNYLSENRSKVDFTHPCNVSDIIGGGFVGINIQ